MREIFWPDGGMVDTRDLKSLAIFSRNGSSPFKGIFQHDNTIVYRVEELKLHPE